MIKEAEFGQLDLELRNQYNQKIHSYWNINKKISPNSKQWDEIRKIKENILRIESNGIKKFYIYKRFLDWEEDRFKSELSDIQNNKITLVNPALFNDPYDCRLPSKTIAEFMQNNRSLGKRYNLKKLINQSVRESYIGASRKIRKEKEKKFMNYELSKNIESESKKMTDNIKKRMRVASFATTPDDMYFWSHYGGTHKGYCVEYEFDDVYFSNFMHPIKYTHEYHNFGISENKLAITLQKSIDWAKEGEWRLIYQVSDDETEEENIKKFPLQNSKISAIYLGLDFFRELKPHQELRRQNLLNCLKEIKFNIYRMELRDDKFQMKTVLFSN